LPDGTKQALLVPQDLSERFDLDLAGVLDYSHQEITSADYQGVFRGAHGAPWAGEANAWDRALLAAAALESENLETGI
jgi:hypothetical protein